MSKGDNSKLTGASGDPVRAPGDPLVIFPPAEGRRRATETQPGKAESQADAAPSPDQIGAPVTQAFHYSDVVVEEAPPNPVADFVKRQAKHAQLGKRDDSQTAPRRMDGGRQGAGKSLLGATPKFVPQESLRNAKDDLVKPTLSDGPEWRRQRLRQLVEGLVHQRIRALPNDTTADLLHATFRSGNEIAAYLVAHESINSDKLLASTEHFLRSALAKMDDEARRNTIAVLMALVGDLQAEGALDAVPPQRLARVALLIGQAHAAVVADPTDTQRASLAAALGHSAKRPPLWKDREPDAKTGKRPTAIEWFDLHWKPRVIAGEVTGDDIRHADTHFYTTWAAALSKRGQKVGDFVPPSPTRGKKPVSEERLAARRAAGVERKRRWREKMRADEPPPLFEERQADATGKMPTALEWFETHWKPRIEPEGLRSDDLKTYDLKLYNALTATQSRADASLGDLIPLSLKRHADMTEEEKAARRARINELSAARMRRYRGSAPK